MRKEGASILLFFKRFAVFLLLSAFIVTCSMVLFLHDSQDTAQLIRERAPLVFVNVFVLALVLTIQDIIRRHYTETIPIRRIMAGVEAITNGDFSYRIEPFLFGSGSNAYNPIIAGINIMAEELSNTETLRTDFIANVSHELKTPLSTISAYCEILQDPSLSEEERALRVQTILRSVRNLSDLITNILRLNRLENQEINSRKEVYSLSNQVVECVLGFETKWEAKGLDINADIAEDVLVEGDSELLSIVWNNLLSNAIKFTEPGGRIGVEVKKSKDFVEVSVSDTGCGISSQTGKHIFDKFYQGDTSHATEGNGLGLSMVKRIVDLHDGRIDVESEVGKGSTFTIHLPVDVAGDKEVLHV